MYPDFSYIMHDIFGTELDNMFNVIKTFGLFLALAFLASSYFLKSELLRREKNGTLVPIKKIVDGKERTILQSEKVGDITIAAAVFGILGAKLFAIFESVNTIKAFIKHPLETFFSGSGLAIYGGLIVAFFGVIWYVKRLGIKPFQIMDATAPSLFIGYGVGRIGCQLSGDGDWGIISALPKPNWFIFPDWLYSQKYPRNVSQDGIQMLDCVGKYCSELAQGVYPTPIYETILAFIFFTILWRLRTKLILPGQLFFLYLIFNGFERFFIEKIRVNERFYFGSISFTQAELIAVILFIIGIVGSIILFKKSKQSSVNV